QPRQRFLCNNLCRMPVTIIDKLRTLKKTFSLTNADLAEHLGVARGTVSSYFARANAKPSADKLKKLTDFFSWYYTVEIPIEWFLDGEDTPVPGVTPRKLAEIAKMRE